MVKIDNSCSYSYYNEEKTTCLQMYTSRRIKTMRLKEKKKKKKNQEKTYANKKM